KARPHRREVGVAGAARVVPCRPQVTGVALLDGEPDGVVDGPCLNLVETDQARKDGEAGGVRRRPRIRPQGVRTEVEDGARPPGLRTVVAGARDLVERTGVLVDGQEVAVRWALDLEV